jgi:hypothetical protein
LAEDANDAIRKVKSDPDQRARFQTWDGAWDGDERYVDCYDFYELKADAAAIEAHDEEDTDYWNNLWDQERYEFKKMVKIIVDPEPECRDGGDHKWRDTGRMPQRCGVCGLQFTESAIEPANIRPEIDGKTVLGVYDHPDSDSAV